MYHGTSKWFEWPLQREAEDSEYDIEYLQNGYGFYGGVEVFCEEVPEDFRPEEAMDTSGKLIY